MRKLSLLLLAWPLVVLLSAPVQAAETPIHDELRAAVELAVAQVTPALVRIHVVSSQFSGGREQKQEAAGSGAIFTPQGDIITNHHVAGNAKQIICTLMSKEDVDAELIGTDPLTDISVIRLRPTKPREFPVAKFGDSSALRVGDHVMAMGSPLALSQSVTLGIVSNTTMVMPDIFGPNRMELEGEDVGSMVRWIGHDAAITGGNSGGPLVNLQGEVVGINEISYGLSGAIPGNLALSVARALVKDGKVTRAWMGIGVQPLLHSNPEAKGVLVGSAAPGSPAAKAGFQTGDIILSINGQAVSVRIGEDLPVFNQLVAALPVGKEAAVGVQRGAEQVTLHVTPQVRESAQPKEREFAEWGLSARDLSQAAARELRRDSRAGAIITTRREGGPSDEAKPKLTEHDVIVAVNGTPVSGVAELAALTAKITAGQTDPVPTLVAFDRRAEHFLTVVKLGKEKLTDPDVEVHKAWLPVATQVVTKDMAAALKLGDKTGVRITQVYPKTEAEAAGLKTGDIITALDGEAIPVTRPEQADVFPTMLRQRKAGAEAELTIWREGAEQKIKVVLPRSPQSPYELKRYRNESFGFTVRDLAFDDRVRQQLPETQGGAFVDAVNEGSWASLAHLSTGDIIVAVDGKPVAGGAELEAATKHVAGARAKAVVFHVRRGVHDLFVELQPKWSNGQ